MVGLDWSRGVVVLALVACGPTVDVGDEEAGGTEESSGDGSGGSSGGPTSSSSSPGTTVGDVATSDDPEPEPDPVFLADLSGEHHLAVAAVIDPAHPLQFTVTVQQESVPGGAQLGLVFTSLSLDPQATTTPRLPVGNPIPVTAMMADDNSLSIDLGVVSIPGAANPITGSDIVATIRLDGYAQSDDLWCGTVSGMVTQPLQLDLSGSTFVGTRIVNGQLPGDPIPTACP